MAGEAVPQTDKLGKKISTKGIHEETKKISTKGHEEPRMDTKRLIDELLIADCFDSRDPVLRSIIPLIIVLHRFTSVPTLIEQNQLFILSLSVKNVGLSSK